MNCQFEIKVLSHACLLVKTNNFSVIIDPWLVGTCYWRSWSNYPPAEFDVRELADVSAVVITHVHWDHWHGPTLKKFFRDKLIIVPRQANSRCRDDLVSIGIEKVREVGHVEELVVGDIKISLYQFGLFLQDSAVVVKAAGHSLLNANDAKLAGLPLRH